MTMPEIVSSERWLAARTELLAREKELTRARDALNADRRRLPMVKVEKDYVLEGPDGHVGLRDLFGDARQLIVQHFMYDPSWDAGCPSCSAGLDEMSTGLLDHLGARETAFAVVARAPFAALDAYRRQRGWTVPLHSSYGSDFNYDFDATDENGEKSGLSVFLRDGKQILHSYSTTGRGVDILLGNYNFLDMTPLGRQEDWEARYNTPAQE
jgi:predicted dithiol-disulfide oxidoreductase (DUF899 family)